MNNTALKIKNVFTAFSALPDQIFDCFPHCGQIKKYLCNVRREVIEFQGKKRKKSFIKGKHLKIIHVENPKRSIKDTINDTYQILLEVRSIDYWEFLKTKAWSLEERSGEQQPAASSPAPQNQSVVIRGTDWHPANLLLLLQHQLMAIVSREGNAFGDREPQCPGTPCVPSPDAWNVAIAHGFPSGLRHI